jgi:threonine dehydratase
MGIAATIVMPEAAPARTKARISANGAKLILVADASTLFDVAEAERGKGLTYIHSYDDPLVIAGHGTAGLEFIGEMPDLTDVLVSIGGGGLISGVAAAVKAVRPAVRVWGVETEGADTMSQALAAGRPVRIKVSSIASTLGAPIVSARSLAHVKALVEQVLLVSDREAVEGVVTFAEEAKLWVEPACGCLLPAARRVIETVGKEVRLGLLACGGNVTLADVQGWIDRFGVQ